MDDQQSSDAAHLKLLSTFHFVVAGLAAFFGCIPILHLSVGIAMITGNFDQGGNGPPDAFGWFFTLFSAFAMVMMWTFAVGLWIAGRKLARRKNYLYCMVMAGLACTFNPFGTVLGVFTIIVLVRPSVKAEFQRNAGERSSFENPVGTSDGDV